jgi:mRNA-degrading endonuclease toxin of MazEF toxin-antitoxin module
MGQFKVGQVVSITFPFSDLKSKKYRPALIVAVADFDNLILCQITSKAYSSTMAIELSEQDFNKGNLPVTSYIRPDKLFTAEESIVSTKYGELKKEKLRNTLAVLCKLFDSP